MTKRVQRPRLEQRAGHEISAELVADVGVIIERRVSDRSQTLGITLLKDMKRLHAFLGKAIAYLEPKRKGGG
jgi:hypothetical protein